METEDVAADGPGSATRRWRGIGLSAAVCVIVAAGLMIAAVTTGAQAPADKVHRIAILTFPSPPPPWTVANIAAFRQRLRELGWVDGRNVVIEVRAVELEQLDEAAARIVSERFDLIVTQALPAALAAKKATTTIPVVMATNADPVGSGAVASLGRPGGNLTGLGFFSHELWGKRLELLREMVPRLGRVAALYPERAVSLPFVVQWVRENESAARSLGLPLQPIAVKDPFDWGSTFAAAKRDGARGVTVIESPELIAQAPVMAAAALKHRLPTVFAVREHVEAGGLMAYGANIRDLWRRAATYVDKILRGTKPADLPIELPTKFDLVINAKTAKALGLTLPPVLRLRATEVIE